MRGEPPIHMAYYGECADLADEKGTAGKRHISNPIQTQKGSQFALNRRLKPPARIG